ncbi:MAG: phosphotransferase [Burkholderiales bacterium]
MSDAADSLTSSAARSPETLIRLYWDEIWNRGHVELIREICADPIVRHDAGSTTPLSHDEQIARVQHARQKIQPHFTHEVLCGDGQHVTSVWNMTGVGPDGQPLPLCGIETFRAENGRFTDCWNSSYMNGHWGRTDDVVQAPPPPEVLRSADQINETWLHRALCASGQTVPRVGKIYEVAPVGNGTAASTWRVRFGYNGMGQGLPESVIVKLPRPDHLDADAAHLDLLGYEREVAAYRFFGDQPPMRIPRCHFAAASNGSFNLVLEDLTDRGLPGNQIAGCDPLHAQAVTREFAAMHTRYWQAPELQTLTWAVRLAERGDLRAHWYDIGVQVMRSQHAELGEEALALIESLAPLVGPWHRAEPRHVTLIHGEPRVDNIFFETAGNTLRACLLDLQLVTVGDPMIDLAYFLSGSLSPEDRQACERGLVEMHVGVLRAAGIDYDVDAAWQSYCEHAVCGLMITVIAAGFLGEMPQTYELIRTLARRNCATVRHLDGLAAAKRRIARPLCW